MPPGLLKLLLSYIAGERTRLPHARQLRGLPPAHYGPIAPLEPGVRPTAGEIGPPPPHYGPRVRRRI
jgi:hypothetical protein